MPRLRDRNTHSLRDSTPTRPTGLHTATACPRSTARNPRNPSPLSPGSQLRNSGPTAPRSRAAAEEEEEAAEEGLPRRVPPRAPRPRHALAAGLRWPSPGAPRRPRSPLTPRPEVRGPRPPPRAAGLRTPGAARGGKGRAGRRAGPSAAGRGRAALTPAGCASSSSRQRQRLPPSAAPTPLRAGAGLAARPALPCPVPSPSQPQAPPAPAYLLQRAAPCLQRAAAERSQPPPCPLPRRPGVRRAALSHPAAPDPRSPAAAARTSSSFLLLAGPRRAARGAPAPAGTGRAQPPLFGHGCASSRTAPEESSHRPRCLYNTVSLIPLTGRTRTAVRPRGGHFATRTATPRP